MASTLALTRRPRSRRKRITTKLSPFTALPSTAVLMTRFGQDLRVTCLAFRSMASWLLGYPEAALHDADCALTEARQIEHAATLMFTLNFPILVNTYCGNYHAAGQHLKELVALAEEKGASFRKAEGVLRRGYILTLTGSCECGRGRQIRYRFMALGRIDDLYTRAGIHAGNRARRFGPVRRCLALHRQCDDGDASNQGKVVRGRGASRCR